MLSTAPAISRFYSTLSLDAKVKPEKQAFAVEAMAGEWEEAQGGLCEGRIPAGRTNASDTKTLFASRFQGRQGLAGSTHPKKGAKKDVPSFKAT